MRSSERKKQAEEIRQEMLRDIEWAIIDGIKREREVSVANFLVKNKKDGR